MLTSDDPCIWVFVDSRDIDNGPCLLGVPQSAQTLLVVGVSGRDCSYHGRSRVTSKALLEQPGEGGVTVRDVHFPPLPRRAVREQRDDLAEGVEGAIDASSLLEPLPRGLSYGRPFTASEVNQVDATHSAVFLTFQDLVSV